MEGENGEQVEERSWIYIDRKNSHWIDIDFRALKKKDKERQRS